MQVEEWRSQARDRMQKENELRDEKDRERRKWEEPVKGDLVLLRRFEVDKDKGRKLETRWEGPYVVAKVSYSGVLVLLHNVNTRMRRGRYSMDAVKLFLSKAEEKEKDQYVPMAKADWMKSSQKTRGARHQK